MRSHTPSRHPLRTWHVPKLLLHLLHAAAQCPHLVAALQWRREGKDGGFGTGCELPIHRQAAGEHDSARCCSSASSTHVQQLGGQQLAHAARGAGDQHGCAWLLQQRAGRRAAAEGNRTSGRRRRRRREEQIGPDQWRVLRPAHHNRCLHCQGGGAAAKRPPRGWGAAESAGSAGPGPGGCAARLHGHGGGLGDAEKVAGRPASANWAVCGPR